LRIILLRPFQKANRGLDVEADVEISGLTVIDSATFLVLPFDAPIDEVKE
jgi:hypothetical protein